MINPRNIFEVGRTVLRRSELYLRVIDAKERFVELPSFGDADEIPLAIGDVRPLTKWSWISMPINDQSIGC